MPGIETFAIYCLKS